MTNGPPASQAGPSQASTTTPNASETALQQSYHNFVPQNAQAGPSQPQAAPQPVQYAQAHLAQPTHSHAPIPGHQNVTQAQTYYMGYPPGAWQNAWQLSGYPYATSGSSPYQQTQYPQMPYAQYQQYQPQLAARQRKPPQKPRSPTPEPIYRHWDEVIRAFLNKVGLTQALRGFEDDMVVLNADWERKSVPGAIGELVRDLMALGKFKEGEEPKERPLEERKLDCIHLSTGAEPRSQSTITKTISQFLAQNRAKNDASNRAEFVESLAQKRRRLNIDPESTEHIPSDSQMKYDIAKNEDGPLRRTVKGSDGKEAQVKEKLGALTDDTPSEHQPAIDERLKNIESHVAVRYVPAPPRTLLARLQFLEDHIISLEKEYPPWAALHFNQPNRGWPPPPRQIPIIVPSHLTSKEGSVERSAASTNAATPHGNADGTAGTATKGKNKNKSSLHRAVMERLEVQKAMNDLAGTQRAG
ncbi:hypothetical protein L210DRAFT_3531146 [Boletus edulis BED1]|uniref:Uncharacterized protein n=1 Tax=Boletus edulis BED1 TaxID=1328754 RepID=A0AAD4C1H8_BOLED|nr:hypothetical protein L210DRAFT_3531146 [Boletus edulis BED1]